MERQLFDWNGWDQQDTASFTFYDVELKVQIGKQTPGTKFSSALIDFQTGELSLYRDDRDEYPCANFKLELLVKEN